MDMMIQNPTTSKRPNMLRRTATNLLTAAGRAASMPARMPHRLPAYAPVSSAALHLRQVSEPGFDASGRERLTDSAWSMVAFTPDGSDTEYLYTGTNTNIIGLSKCAMSKESLEEA